MLISSQAAHEGAKGHTAYASAKGAVEGYLAPASAELIEKDMRINVVCPGPVRTVMSEEWIQRLYADEEKLMKDYPLGMTEVGDVAELITWLLSDKARRVSGQIIPIGVGIKC